MRPCKDCKNSTQCSLDGACASLLAKGFGSYRPAGAPGRATPAPAPHKRPPGPAMVVGTILDDGYRLRWIMFMLFSQEPRAELMTEALAMQVERGMHNRLALDAAIRLVPL